MGDLLNQAEQTIEEIRHWFVWMAVALMIVVVLQAIMTGFVIWGMLRIAKLAEINRFPINPARPQEALLYGGGRQSS